MSDSDIRTEFWGKGFATFWGKLFKFWGKVFQFWGNVFAAFWMSVFETGLILLEFWGILEGKVIWLCWMLFCWIELNAETDWIGNGSSFVLDLFGPDWFGWTIVLWLDEARGGTSKMDPKVLPWRSASSENVKNWKKNYWGFNYYTLHWIKSKACTYAYCFHRCAIL